MVIQKFIRTCFLFTLLGNLISDDYWRCSKPIKNSLNGNITLRWLLLTSLRTKKQWKATRQDDKGNYSVWELFSLTKSNTWKVQTSIETLFELWMTLDVFVALQFLILLTFSFLLSQQSDKSVVENFLNVLFNNQRFFFFSTVLEIALE